MTAAVDPPFPVAADLARVLAGVAYGEFLPADAAALTPAARLAHLDAVDEVLAKARTSVADARARVIAEFADTCSTRTAATALGVSPSAVAKAIARARLRR